MKICVVFLCLLIAAAGVDTDPRDVGALKALHKSLEDPLRKLSSWNSGDPCVDSWEGVICESVGNSLSVTELHLMNSNLSGTIAPELGAMLNLKILNLMWNDIRGSIPASLGNVTSIELMLLNGNLLTGPIPPELGNLQSMNRFQIDENNISGPIPSTFGMLTAMKHLHMNNNSLTGSIPPELGKLPTLFHILVDNNQMSGQLPVELANISTLQILQTDHNNLSSTIPPEYGDMKRLLKMSMRNCNLRGSIPDISKLEKLEYLDLSENGLSGELPTALPPNVTTVNLAKNQLQGNLSSSLLNNEKLQALLLSDNKLAGLIPIEFVRPRTPSQTLILDLQSNVLEGFTDDFNGRTDASVSIRLYGNPKLCGNSTTIPALCTQKSFDQRVYDVNFENVTGQCDPQSCDPLISEMMPALAAEGKCRCASRIVIHCRLKSPGFTFFASYRQLFSDYIADDLGLLRRQVYVASSTWEPGPRLFLNLKIFPPMVNDKDSRELNASEVRRIFEKFASWKILDNPLFGPRELLAFYSPFGIDIFHQNMAKKKGLNKGAIAGVLVGVILGTGLVVALVAFKFARRRQRKYTVTSKGSLHAVSRSGVSVKIDNVRAFKFHDMSVATDSFSGARQVVAIKRADLESHQGEAEFFTEIELLSRIHHRNLVSLIGFCLDQDEQMLVYEFIGGGTLQDRLTKKPPLNFKRRVNIALGAARGILYLHTEANPPIIHRDIKGTNILIGDKDNAKVSDFGLSKLAPEELADGASGHVSTVVKGTPGYLDPEYFLTRKLSDKSDIYSFGVVLLELVTGLQAISHGKNLVREVRVAYDEGMALTIVDPFMGPYPSEAMEPFIRLALSCCADVPEGRPPIRSVVRDLEDIWKSMASWDHEEHESEAEMKTPKSSSPFFEIASGSSSKLDDYSAANLGPVAPR